MDKIFYAQKYEYPCSETAVLKILHEYFKLDEVSVKGRKTASRTKTYAHRYIFPFRIRIRCSLSPFPIRKSV